MSSDGLSEDAEFPACPSCETNLLVGRSTAQHLDWHCHGCDTRYRHSEMPTSDTYDRYKRGFGAERRDE